MSSEQRILAIKEAVGPGKNISQGKLSKLTGISGGTLSTILNGNYKSSGLEPMLDTIEAALERIALQKEVPFKEPDFVFTKVARTIFNALSDAVTVVIPRITVLYGDSGIGKTKAVKEWAKANSTAVVIAIRSDFTGSTAIKKIADKIRVSSKGTVSNIIDRIISKLYDTKQLIVLDEAEYLSPRTLDMIRRIHDESGAPVVLLGLDRLHDNLINLRPAFTQVANRMVSNCVDLMNSDDMFSIAQSAYPDGSESVLKAFCAHSKLCPRTMILTMQDLINLESRSENFKITPQSISERFSSMH